MNIKKGAVIGFGTIAQGHLAAYRDMTELSITAIVDSSPARLELAKLAAPDVEVFDTMAGLFSRHKLDFIDICVPPNIHKEFICSGLLNDCHVMCEKPFLLSSADYKDVLSLSKSVNKTVYPCHNYKFSPVLSLAKKLVSCEQFGQVVTGHFRTLRSGHAVGVPEWKPDWRRSADISGGGILRDHGTHSVYMACRMCGQIPRAVSCIIGNLQADKYSTEDTALLTMYFDDNIQFSINLSWATGFRNTFYSIVGTKESIVIEDDDFIRTTKDGNIVRQILSSEFNDPSHSSWYRNLLVDFTDLMAHPDRQLLLLEEALVTTLVIERSYISAREKGIVVELPDISRFFE
jgi:predicted dehydrogenase